MVNGLYLSVETVNGGTLYLDKPNETISDCNSTVFFIVPFFANEFLTFSVFSPFSVDPILKGIRRSGKEK